MFYAVGVASLMLDAFPCCVLLYACSLCVIYVLQLFVVAHSPIKNQAKTQASETSSLYAY